MTRFFSHENEGENSSMNIVPAEAVVLSDEELEAVAGSYMLAGPAGRLDWLKRQLYYKTHPGQMQPLVTATTL